MLKVLGKSIVADWSCKEDIRLPLYETFRTMFIVVTSQSRLGTLPIVQQASKQYKHTIPQTQSEREGFRSLDRTQESRGIRSTAAPVKAIAFFSRPNS